MEDFIKALFWVVVLILIFPFVFMLLWNWLMPLIFGLTELTFWQAWGVMIMCELMFGSTNVIK